MKASARHILVSDKKLCQNIKKEILPDEEKMSFDDFFGFEGGDQQEDSFIGYV